MRTLSGPTNTAVESLSARPAYLVAISWSTLITITSGDTLTWGAYTWYNHDIRLSNLEWNKDGLVSATLLLGNNNATYSALALNEGIADKSVVIWYYDQSATAIGDPVRIYDGSGGRCAINDQFISLSLVSQRIGTLKSPRIKITPGNGFSNLPPEKYVINWGGEKYVLTGRK